MPEGDIWQVGEQPHQRRAIRAPCALRHNMARARKGAACCFGSMPRLLRRQLTLAAWPPSLLPCELIPVCYGLNAVSLEALSILPSTGIQCHRLGSHLFVALRSKTSATLLAAPPCPVQVVIAVSLALNYIHSQKNIVHRDLTPANIVLGQVRQRYTGICSRCTKATQ